MAELVVSADPGLKGGVAILDAEPLIPELHMVWHMPLHVVNKREMVDPARLWGSIDEALELLSPAEPSAVVIELNSAMPGQGVTSMYRFGQATGVLSATLELVTSAPVHWVTPAVWKRSLGLTGSKGSKPSKAASRDRATQLWPKHREAFTRAKDDGVAEAALIGYHWIMKQRG